MTATLVAAASDSSDAARADADYVCDGSNDRQVLQAALEALPNGGRLVLLEGTYNIPSPGLEARINCHIVGQGDLGTTLQVPDGEGAAYDLLTLDYIVRVENLNCYGNNLNAGAGPVTGIRVNNQSCHLNQISVSRLTGDGIIILGDYCRLLNSGLENNDGHGVYCSQFHNGVISGGLFRQNVGDGIFVDDAGDGIITGIRSVFNQGAAIRTQVGQWANLLIQGNYFNGDREGVSIENAGGDVVFDTYIDVIANRFQSIGQKGIYCEKNVNLIAQNRLQGTGNWNPNTYDAIEIAGDENSVTGNRVAEDDGTTPQARYGINVASGNDNLVTNNDLLNAGQTANFNDAGTGTITTAGNRV